MQALIYVVSLGLAGCGSSSPANPGSPILGIEVQVEGLREAVQVDSVFWDARSWAPTASGEFEISGRYALSFRNLTDQPLALRYDLRFLDLDTFLIDVFNPFNLPLRLEAHQTWREGGDYFIRTDEPRALDELQTMLVHVVVQQAP